MNPTSGNVTDMELSVPLDSLQIEAPYFDLESYISRYEGLSKIHRLRFISKRCPSVQNEAYRLAIKELKAGVNTAIYKEIIAEIGDSLGPELTLDSAWVEATDRRSHQTQEKLELELNQFKTNLIKESIRMGYHELGQHHLARGDLAVAFKNFVRTRDYCATGRHSAEMCLAVVKVSVLMGNWIHVNNYVVKAEHSPEVSTVPEVCGKLQAASGLVQLEARKYKQAAMKFIKVDPAMGADFCEVLAPEDVAVYGGLCALATFDRQELKTQVMENAQFKDYLDLMPQVRELINDVYNSRYASCLNRLAEMRKDSVDLDIYLHCHVDTLYQRIRDNCLCQYFSPFLSVSLGSITQAFGMSEEALRKELTKLIVDGRIKARIDSKAGTLHLNQFDERRLSYRKALSMGASYKREARSLLLRLSCMQHDFVVRPPKRRGGGILGPELRGGNSQDAGMAMSEAAEDLL